MPSPQTTALMLPLLMALGACQTAGVERAAAPAAVALPGDTVSSGRLADWTAALERPLETADARGVAKTEAEAAAAVEAARAVLRDTRSRLAATRARVVQSRLPRATLDRVISDGRAEAATMRRAARAVAARRGALGPSVGDGALAVLERRARELGDLAAALEAEL